MGTYSRQGLQCETEKKLCAVSPKCLKDLSVPFHSKGVPKISQNICSLPDWSKVYVQSCKKFQFSLHATGARITRMSLHGNALGQQAKGDILAKTTVLTLLF